MDWRRLGVEGLSAELGDMEVSCALASRVGHFKTAERYHMPEQIDEHHFTLLNSQASGVKFALTTRLANKELLSFRQPSGYTFTKGFHHNAFEDVSE